MKTITVRCSVCGTTQLTANFEEGIASLGRTEGWVTRDVRDEVVLGSGNVQSRSLSLHVCPLCVPDLVPPVHPSLLRTP